MKRKNMYLLILLGLLFFPSLNVKAEENNTNLYEMIKSKADTKTSINFNKNSSTSGTNGIYTTKSTDTGLPVYYYRGKVDNNIYYNDICWKIVRTTETNGTKLIYNGKAKTYYYYDIVSKDNYNVTNSTTYAYSYKDGTWTSTNKDKSSTGSIEISNLTGDYVINYTASTEEDFDIGYIYLNSTEQLQFTGSDNGQLLLSELKSTDVIKIEYVKDSSGSDLNDSIEFNIGKPNGQKSINCDNSGEDSTIGSSAFNTLYTDNAYVGYMYGNISSASTSYTEAHANVNSSTIKTLLETWYTNNFATDVASKVEDTVYCNDRSTFTYDSNYISSSYSKYGTLGYGANTSLYGVMGRAGSETIQINPTLKCSRTDDKFTVSSSNGNGKLNKPVGLITLDEAALAGFNSESSDEDEYSDDNYLYNGDYYWTMTPTYFSNNGTAKVGCLYNNLNEYQVRTSYGVRPVISLNNDTLIETTGTGTSTNPYKVILHTITFNTNGGNSISPVYTYTVNEKISEVTPIREHYHFEGWYTNEELTTKYDFNTGVTSDFTLYAKWTKVYTYDFVLKGDEQTFVISKIDNYTITIDGDYSLFEDLIIEGVTLEKDKDYTVREGSTIITFTEDGLNKLNKLNLGSYNVTVKYTNGKEANGKLNIIDEAKATSASNPKTYDSITTWIILASISIIAIIAVLIYKKKINNR